MSRLTVGLIGGSGLLKTDLAALKDLTEEMVDTSHGRVFLRTGTLSPTERLVFVQRHDATPMRSYTQPSDVNYQAILLAMKAKGVDFIVGICSVGSLKASLEVGTLMTPDDFYCPDDLRRIFRDFRAHFMPAIDDTLRQAILTTVRAAGYHPEPRGTYVNSHGPRFETKAEIRIMAQAGDIVGMTAAHEISAACELGIPYGALAMVDNYANGLDPKLNLSSFHEAQAKNRPVVEACVGAILSNLGRVWAATADGIARIAKRDADAAAASVASSNSSSSSSTSSSVSGASSSGAGAHPTPPSPIAIDTLIHARYIVPVAPGDEGRILAHHSLAILGGVIHEILPTSAASAKYAPAKVVSLGEHHVLIPGLINAHTHIPMNLMKGLSDDLPLARWLSEEVWPCEGKHVSPEFCKAGASAACAELLRGGVTGINDMYFFPDAIAQAVHESGLRATLGMVVLEFPTNYAANAGEYFDKGLAVKTAWDKKQSAAGASGNSSSSSSSSSSSTAPPRISWSIAPHAPYTVSEASFGRAAGLSRSLSIPLHVHLHETEGECVCSRAGTPSPTTHMSAAKCSPLENYAALGHLTERTIAVHMTQLTDGEIALLAAAKSNVVHCPSSNLKLASGFCPVPALLKAGVNVAIGTDGCASNNTLDMFAEMKLAALLSKGSSKDATAVPAWQALRMATLNGAIAVGQGHITGSLQVGKRADVVAVSLGSLEELPLYNVISHLVYVCGRKAVTDVWVDGQALLAGRQLLTIDEAAVRASLAEWAGKIKPGVDGGAVGAASEGEGGVLGRAMEGLSPEHKKARRE